MQLLSSPSDAYQPLGPGPDPASVKAVSGRAVKVLIIDDEKDLVELLAFRLRSSGRFEVETAYDGDAGLDKVDSFVPDIVLLDLLMPTMDGWEVCRLLRSSPETKSLPVVMMTAVRSSVAEEQAERLGIRRVVFKPFDDRKLVGLLLDALPGGGA